MEMEMEMEMEKTIRSCLFSTDNKEENLAHLLLALESWVGSFCVPLTRDTFAHRCLQLCFNRCVPVEDEVYEMMTYIEMMAEKGILRVDGPWYTLVFDPSVFSEALRKLLLQKQNHLL